MRERERDESREYERERERREGGERVKICQKDTVR